jgi:cyclopropane fatty-acyl-phospholipid synthase-like methyltransferase
MVISRLNEPWMHSDYPRTLREWGRRFQKSWDQLSGELLKAHPELSEGQNLDILRRKWEYLYVYAEIGFARAYTSCHNWIFVRPVSRIRLYVIEPPNSTLLKENSVEYCG